MQNTLTPGKSFTTLAIVMTKKRQLVLDVLEARGIPLNAAQVHEEASAIADLATVYRSLHYLEKNHYINSFVFECHERGIERYYSISSTHHRHYMHCEECHRFFSLDFCPLSESLEQLEAETGFKIEGHNLTITGTCQDCR